MKSDELDDYIKAITPAEGDPTFSVLKAHLLIEEKLRAYLQSVLPHAEALEGARLSFAQVVAVARACSRDPEDWTWKAISKLNKIRNTLSHEISSDALKPTIEAYVAYVTQNTGVPLPKPTYTSDDAVESRAPGIYLLSVDMVTAALYARLKRRLGV